MDARVVVFLTIVAAATAGPLKTQHESKSCATECNGSNNFKYNSRTTYVYDYKVDTDSSIAGAFEDSAKTTLQTSVSIEVISPCEFALQLRNTKLSHTDGRGAMKTANREDEFRSELESYPLMFSFQNGIVDHVCPDKEESVHSLNMKRGILSAFQNSMDNPSQSQNVTETDVVGTCKAEYTVVGNGYYTTDVKKVKDILSCTDRQGFMSTIQHTPYKVPSDLQNLPIMKTSHECDQTIQNEGILKKSVCKETHVYRPFANGESGARTTISQTLAYQTYRSGISRRTAHIKGQSSLLFDHSADHLTKQQSRMTVEKKLNEVCGSTRSDVRPETPRLFSELVVVMKGLDNTDLAELHRLLKTKTLCPTNEKAYKFFHDALPMLNTKGSVSLMTELINTQDVTGMEASAWLTSLAFIQFPAFDMLLDAKTLLDNKDIHREAMLPVSSMVNNYCRNMATCDQDPAVLSVVASLERNIDYSCDASGKKFELTLLTLKALGNVGHTSRAIPTLNKCLTSTSNPIEVRVAAADAFRRMPCDDDDENKSLWDTFTAKDLDSELRITAYLALMRCPTQENLVRIAANLNTEDDEQVGAFVYSHLTNLKETSDPHKQAVVDIVNNLSLEKEFDISPVKFSRNFEVSALLNKINTGVTAESNLIWSNNVQLPRAVSGNLTVQLFGQSINLLDFGGRFEGLEYLIKNVLGPYINSNEMPKFDSNSVRGSFFGRVFGNEMLFMHSHTSKSVFGDKTPTYLDILIKMANQQHVTLTHSVNFIDVCMVIPSSAGLPIHISVNGTATVDLDMSGKVDLRKAGASPRSLDIDGQIRPSAALEITGSMFVNSFVAKTGLRMRNTMHTSTMIKGRLQLTRGQQLNIELDTPEEKMEVFDARSKFVLLHDNAEQEQEMIKENRKDFKVCSSDRVTQVTGMEVCGQLTFPNASMKTDSPYFPFTRPTAVTLTLFKRDTHSGYKLFAKKVGSKKASIAQISFNTPGSKVNRLISIDTTINYRKQDAEMNLATPWKKLAVKGNLVNTKNLKSVEGSVVIDDKHTYSVTGEIKVSRSKSKIQFNPMIEFKRPGAENIKVSGLMAMEKPFKNINMIFSLSGIDELPFTFKSALINNKKEKSVEASMSLDGKGEYSFKASNKLSVMGKKSVIAVIQTLLEVRSPQRNLMSLSNNVDYREGKSLKLVTSMNMYRVMKKPATLKVNLLKTARKKATNYKAVVNMKTSHISGNVVCNINKKQRGSVSATSKIDYTVPRVTKKTINLSGKLFDRSTKAYTSYIVHSSVGVKENPEYNNNVKIEVGHKKKFSYVSADLTYGAPPKDKTKRIYLLTSLNKKVANMKNALVNYKVKAQAPAHNIDILLQGKHEHSPKLLDSSVTLTYAPTKDIGFGVSLRNKGSTLANVNGKATLSWPRQEYLITSHLSQRNAKQYSHLLNFKSSSGTKHAISTVYKRPKAGAHDMVTEFMLHGLEPVSISATTNLKMNNFVASMGVKNGKDVYGFKAISKFSKAPSAKMSLDLIHPSRHIAVDVSGSKGSGKYEGKIETAWDVDNDKNQKMSLEGSCFHKSDRKNTLLGGHVNFRSPFTKFENLLGSVKYGMDQSQHSLNGRVMWGDKTDQIMTIVTVKKPMNINNVHFNGNIKTPFEGFRRAKLDIAHTLDNELSTVITGDVENETAKLSIQGQKLTDGYKGSMNLKSTIKNAESITLSASHTDSDGKCKSSAELKHNGDAHVYGLALSHSGNGWQVKTSGNFILTSNKNKFTTQWEHNNTDDSINTSLTFKWNSNRVIVDLTASHKMSALRNINGVLKIKTPWKPLRDVEVNIDHTHGYALVNSVVFLKQGSIKRASSTVNYMVRKSSHDFDFMVVSPFHEDLSGTFNINYEKYPITTSAELTWAPKMKGTVEGSLNLVSWKTSDIVFKMTTPSRTIRNIVMVASNKKENGELVSSLSMDYGMRQSIVMESRFTNDNLNKMLRFKLNTPFTKLKSLNTGLNFNGNAYTFDSTADFEFLPNIGKFNGAVNWQYDNELNGKFRLDTPFPEYPYLELSTSSKTVGPSRKSHVKVSYYPYKEFNVATTYSFGSPHFIRANIRSPYADFDNIELFALHERVGSSVNSRGQVKYQSDKNIEVDIKADWSSDIKAGFLVKTPFQGYENTNFSMRHRGSLNDSETHGEINVVEKRLTADASFKSGYISTGTFLFTSPIPYFEKIDVSLKKKGNKRNFKTLASIDVNGDTLQTTFTNKMTKNALKTNLNLMTSRTDPFKFTLDHSGAIDSFTNKININYGRQIDIDTVLTFDLRGDNVNGNAILKYKMNGNRNTASASFTKNGPMDDLSFSTVTSLNKDNIKIMGSFKTKDIIEASVQVMTPFKNLKKTGMTFTHSGDATSFTSNANINFMNKKDINGKFDFSSNNGFKLSSKLTTPFKSFESTSVIVNHESSDYTDDISGTAELITTIGRLGTTSVAYRKTGASSKLNLMGSISSNGREMVVAKLTNNLQDNEIHSMCSLQSIGTPDVFFSIDHSGNTLNFSTKAMGKVGKNTLSTEANMKRGFDSIAADGSVTYKLRGQSENTASITLQLTGPLDNCNVELTGKLNNDVVKVTASGSGALNDMRFQGSAGYKKKYIDITAAWKHAENIQASLKVLTPFDNFNNVGMDLSYSGDVSSVATNFNLNYMDDKRINGRLFLSDRNGFKLSGEMATPFTTFELTSIKVDHVTSDLSNDLTGTAEISTTIAGIGTREISYSKTGDINNISMGVLVFLNGNELAVARLTNNLQDNEIHSMCSLQSIGTPDVFFSIDHSGNTLNFSTKAMGKVGKNTLSTEANMKRGFDSIAADGSVTYKLRGQSENTASITLQLTGPLDNCNVELTGKLNNDVVKVTASGSGALNDMRFAGSANYNGRSIDITGGWRNAESIKGTFKVTTPFENFNNVGVSLLYSGDSAGFSTNVNINYMDRKNINAKVEYSNLKGIKLLGELKTPFNNFQSTSFKMYHKIDVFTADVSGTVELATVIGRFGIGNVSYKRTGRLCDIVLDGSVLYNRQEMAKLKLTNDMHTSGIYSTCSLESVATPDIHFSIEHSGDAFSINTKAMGRIGKNELSADASMKQGAESISADGSIAYKLQGQHKNKALIALQMAGPLDRCSIKLIGKFNKEELKLSASRSGPLNDISFSGCAGYNRKSINISGIWKNTDNVEASLKLITPFNDFNQVGLRVSHSGDVSDFATSFNINYMEGKDINGKVELSANSLNHIRFVSEMTTPFEHLSTFAMEMNNRYDSYSSDLNGGAMIQTYVSDVGTRSIVYSKTGGWNNFEVTGKILRNGADISELKIKNDLGRQELHSSLEYKSSVTPRVLLTLDHNGDLTSLKSNARLTVGNRNVFNGEATLNQGSQTIEGEAKLMYTIHNTESHQFSLTFHKEGQLDNFNFDITGKNGATTSTITGYFKNEDELKGSINMNTPFDGYGDVGASFKYSGVMDRFKCEGKVVPIDGNEFVGKLDFYRHLFHHIEAVVELNTPITELEFTKFEYSHKGESDGFKCFTALQLSNSRVFEYDMSATSTPKPELNVVFKVPQEKIMASGSYELSWPRYAVNGKLSGGEGRSVSLHSLLDASKDVIGVFTLSTPMNGFNNIGLSFHHTLTATGIKSEGKLTYMDGKIITGKTEATVSKSETKMSLEFTTPISGYEFTGFETHYADNKRKTKAFTTFVYGDNQRIVIDAYSKTTPIPEISFTAISPFSEAIEIFASLENNWPKHQLTCKIAPGNGDKFSMNAIFDATNDISGSLNVETPFHNYNKIGMNFMHSGNTDKFGTEATITYMDGRDIIGKVNFYRYMWRRIDASLELNTPFTGMETSKADVNFEDNSNSISTTAALEYNNGQRMNGNVKFSYYPNYDVMITFATPDNVNKVYGALDLTAPNYEVMCSLSHGHNMVYSTNGKFNFYSVDHFDGSLEVNTPLSGFEYTKVEYQHKLESSALDGSISLIYDDERKMSFDIKSNMSPGFDGLISLRTPFEGFEIVEGSVAFGSSYKKYEASSSLKLGQGAIFSMTSELDYSVEPMKAIAKFNSPLTHFRKIELDLSHEGSLTNFRSAGFLSSPITGNVDAKASLEYGGLMNMIAAASLQTSLEGFDDLKAELKTSAVAGEMKTSGLFGWTSGQEVTLDGTFHKREGWSEDMTHADVGITTPFIAVRSVNIQMDHSAGSESYVEKIKFELNGDNLLDFDAKYTSSDKKTAELIVRQPWPMHYSTSKYNYDGTADAEAYFNWNTNEANSNVRVQALMTDTTSRFQVENDLDLSVTYASHKVGVVNKLSLSQSHLLANGHVYWNSDGDSQVSYDVHVNENNRRDKHVVDGSFKLGLPTRTLGLTVSYSQNSGIASTEATFSWDMDRDNSKQVGIETNVNLGDVVKGDITLKMPSLRKEIRVDGELMLNNGRILLDTKTDISYSKDARKTLTLTSKLEDVSTPDSHFNYTLALGLRHAYTDVDLSMHSHIGKSDESMTLGVSTSYLTSKKQMKNMALLSEIDLLKRQISLQLHDPINAVEIVGGIVRESPYKMRLMNKMNGQETFRSDVTVDMDRKSFVVNAFANSDILTVTAKYPNTTAFTVDFARHTPDLDQQEALMAVRLNTSRLLLTRLSWRPDMVEDFKEYALPKLLDAAESAIGHVTSLNEEIADELGSKYTAISNELNQELQPFITALNDQLALIAEKMIGFSEDLKKMYENDAFYIQNLGERVLKLQAKMERLTQRYTASYPRLIDSLRENLYEMRRFHAGAHYKHFVTRPSALLFSESMKSLASLEFYLAEVDLVLREYTSSMMIVKQKAMSTIYNATYVDYLSRQLDRVDHLDMSPYTPSFHLPDEFTGVVYNISSKVNTQLNDLLGGTDLEFVTDGVNEVFQQGVWVYNYWQLEENMEKHVKSILKAIKEIVQEELKDNSEDIKYLLQNPITVWDPEHGNIQAQIPLPVAVHRLDQAPDMTPLIAKVDALRLSYLPDRHTWDNLVKSVSKMLPAKSESDETLKEQLKSYNKSSKKYFKKGRKYKVKRSKQRRLQRLAPTLPSPRPFR